MITKLSDHVLKFRAYDPESIENDLNAAVETAIQQAMVQRLHGVMVTQLGYTSYTVALSRDVPYGQTHERRQWAFES